MTVLPPDARKNLETLIKAAVSGQQAATATIDNEWVTQQPEMLLMGLVELRTAEDPLVCTDLSPQSTRLTNLRYGSRGLQFSAATRYARPRMASTTLRSCL